MIVLCPSRNRPERANDAMRSARDTAADPDGFRYLVLVDEDDPTLPEYRALGLDVMEVRPGGYVSALNQAALALADETDIIGAYQDDLMFRTPGWDRRVRETLATPGMAYGDDLLQGEHHPTALFVSTVIIKALGWLALPTIWHQWADDVWKALGQAAGCLRYMPDVVIEHIHPANGKAPMDPGYERVFGANEGASERATSDYYAYHGWLEDRMDIDVAKVRAVL
jgi:hypothetical protein